MREKFNIPIFPLNGAIFFPNTDLPLNIFEKRYIEMIDFSFSKNKVIGMVQLKENGELYSKGCLGKITSFNESEDGRYIINLRGKNIFSIVNETKSEQSFRSADINKYSYFLENISEFNLDSKKKESFLFLFFKFIKQQNYELDFSFLNKIDAPELVKFVSMLSPFSVAEKQMLLESKSLRDLYDKLIVLFKFNVNDKENIQIPN